MGKATRWLRSLLGSSKKSPSTSPATKESRKSNSGFKRGQFKSSETNSLAQQAAAWAGEDVDANKHAIAVAAATAAVAEAALAAAQAAAEVVRLTSSGTSRSLPSAYGGGGSSLSSRDWRRESAAVKIQSAFRAYLARRALRALKGLVKLQAIVRGRIVRKQSADMLRRMQTLARIQARACSSRTCVTGYSRSFSKSSQLPLAGNTKYSKYDQQRPFGGKHGPSLKRGGSNSRFDLNVRNVGLTSSWLDRWMEESTWNNTDASFQKVSLEDEKTDKILEIDTWKPRNHSRQAESTFQGTQYFAAWKENRQGLTKWDSMSGLSMKYQKPNPSVSSGEVTSLKSPTFPQQEDHVLAWTAENSPHGRSSASRPGSANQRVPFTPTRSECSRSLFGEYVGYPNYMTNTESSLAKLRSHSAPRQRMQPEKLGAGRQLVYGNWDVETCSEKGFSPQANFRSKAYPGSVQKNRLKG